MEEGGGMILNTREGDREGATIGWLFLFFFSFPSFCCNVCSLTTLLFRVCGGPDVCVFRLRIPYRRASSCSHSFCPIFIYIPDTAL